MLDLLAQAFGLAVRRRVVGLQPFDLDVERGPWLDGQARLGAALRRRAEIRIGPGRSLTLPIGEVGLDPGFHLGRIEVPHCNQRRPFGAIELAVEVGDQVMAGAPNHADLADRQAARGQLVLQEEVQARLVGAQLRRVARALLGQDDAALPVDGGGIQQQPVGAFAHQGDGLVEAVLVRIGQVELIDRLGLGGGGVGVGAEGQAQALQPLDHVAFRHVLGAVEGHVFEEVGEPLLDVGLHQRAGVEPQAQRSLPRWGRVALDGVAHAVRQHAEAHIGVRRDVAPGLRPRMDGGRRGLGQGCGERRGGEGEAGRQRGQGRLGDHETAGLAGRACKLARRCGQGKTKPRRRGDAG